jgi:uncharacterized protein (DUF433 family)
MAEICSGHVEVDPLVNEGIPVVGSRHIPVWRIAVWHDQMGWGPDEIATECGLTLGEVYAALAYAYNHREAGAPVDQTSG